MPLDVVAAGRARGGVRARSARTGAGSTSWCTRSRGRRRTTCRAGCSTARAEGFAKAMDISCHSFIRMARLAAPLMNDGGTLFAMSYHGAQQGRAELQRDGPGQGGARGVARATSPTSSARRASACTPISPGPLKTRAASGLKDFDLLLNEAAQRAPIGELVDIMDVGLHLRVPRDALCPADVGRNAVRRRRRAHHGVTTSPRTRGDSIVVCRRPRELTRRRSSSARPS